MPPGKTDVLVNLSAGILESSDAGRSLLYKGGHNHDAGRPEETFETDSFRFGKPGFRKTKLKVTEFGSLIRVKAVSPNAPELKVASDLLRIEVPDLVRLPVIPPADTFSGYYLVGGGGIDNQDGGGGEHIHPSNHWGTHDQVAAIDEVSTLYMYERILAKRQENPNFNDIGSNVKVLVNDMSLPRGGLFDVGDGRRWLTPHSEHRDGTEVDMGTERSPIDPLVVQLWAKVTGKNPLVHDGSDGFPLHIHASVVKDF